MSECAATKHGAGDPCRVITPEVKRIEVVAGILWRGPRFLAACRPAGSVHAGLWEFPGGKVEPGESTEAALVRELREELDVRVLTNQDVGVLANQGVRVHAPQDVDSVAKQGTAAKAAGAAVLDGTSPAVEYWRTLEHTYTAPPRHVVLHFFHVRHFTGEPCSCDGQELRWVTAAEARHLPFLAADAPVVRDLEACTFPRA